MSRDGAPRWTVKPRRMGTVHIVRYWTTYKDGAEVDHYEERSLAEAYVAFQNRRVAANA